MLNKETVQAFFREKSSRPMSFREIIRLMGLSKSEAFDGSEQIRGEIAEEGSERNAS
jgi:hypothetical protein